jgi:class 3 adenylate cyclase
VASEAGAVVKTIGDAVMATFPTPDRALAAALRMREAMTRINAKRGSEDLLLKIGIHEGPCLAVRLTNSQDYFGQVEDPNAAKILQSQSLRPSMRRAALRGIADETTVYEIP